MKKLNRKQYKEQIKNFRKVNPLAQVQHKWVTFRDEYNKEVLMFVHNSNICRENSNCSFNKWNCFKLGTHFVTIEFYGHPSLAFDHINGIKINQFNPSYFKVNLNNNFRVLEGAEVAKRYNELFERTQNWYRDVYKEK